VEEDQQIHTDDDVDGGGALLSTKTVQQAGKRESSLAKGGWVQGLLNREQQSDSGLLVVVYGIWAVLYACKQACVQTASNTSEPGRRVATADQRRRRLTASSYMMCCEFVAR
jgi:hypothetical protein